MAATFYLETLKLYLFTMNDTFIDFQVKQYSQAYIYLKAELVTLIGF